MELRPPEPGPLRLLPPLGHESSINEYQGLVRRGSSESKRDARDGGLKRRSLQSTLDLESGKVYRRWERLAGSDADCGCGRIMPQPDIWAIS